MSEGLWQMRRLLKTNFNLLYSFIIIIDLQHCIYVYFIDNNIFLGCSWAKLSIVITPLFYSVLCVKIVADFLQYLFVLRLLLLCLVLYFPWHAVHLMQFPNAVFLNFCMAAYWSIVHLSRSIPDNIYLYKFVCINRVFYS